MLILVEQLYLFVLEVEVEEEEEVAVEVEEQDVEEVVLLYVVVEEVVDVVL